MVPWRGSIVRPSKSMRTGPHRSWPTTGPPSRTSTPPAARGTSAPTPARPSPTTATASSQRTWASTNRGNRPAKKIPIRWWNRCGWFRSGSKPQCDPKLDLAQPDEDTDMAQTYDVIIIGSGPNGLTIGAYLSKAGQKVLLLEKRFEAGGGLCTEQVTIPEFYHNTHAVYMLMADYAPVYADFQFEERYNVKHIFPDLQVCMPLADGRALSIYRDVDKTCASIAQFSNKDADSYRDMQRRFDEMMQHILGPQPYVPFEAAPMMAAKAEMTELGRALTEYTEKTPEEIVCE